jgi:Flp pilus assembly protein TadG
MFGLLAMAMFLMMGAAVDYGRWLHARDQTHAAIDSAVLAAGRALQIDPDNVDGALEIAANFYVENTKTRIDLASDDIAFVTVDNNTAVTAQGSAYIATLVLGLINIDRIPLFTLSGSEFSKAVIAAGGSSSTDLEIALMLDTSGSMDDNNKMEDMQAAAVDLVNIVVREDQSVRTSKMSLAPFSADMRVPSEYLDAVRGTGPFGTVTYSYKCGTKTCKANYTVTPCVVERAGEEKYSDAAPGIGSYVLPAYAAASKNGACSQPESNAMMPLTSDKDALIARINGLQIGGGTAGHLGTAWAWYTLAPEWNSVWSGSPAADYNGEETTKIAILMTDGEYNTQYDANGVKTSSSGAGAAVNGGSNVQAKALCDGMKAKGITVYTVGFDLGGNATAIETLQYCATDPDKFYNAEDGDQLKQAFRDIALKLSDLYLAR